MKPLLPPLRARLSAFASAILASLLLAVAPAAFAQISFAPDLTDIYGVTSEPGWSLQDRAAWSHRCAHTSLPSLGGITSSPDKQRRSRLGVPHASV